MSRSQRDLIQVLRRHRRRPVAGAILAEELGVSLRTIYRDIETLKAQGAHIDGEAGIGYVLRPGFMLPPLMFTKEEIEALVLGSRWVSGRTDGPLGDAARNALAKISAVLPEDLKDGLDASSLLIGPGGPLAAGIQNWLLSAPPFDRKESCRSLTPTAVAAPPNGRSGRSLLPSSIARAWSWLGVNCVRGTVIFEPSESRG
jgi:biotin operon repressor